MENYQPYQPKFSYLYIISPVGSTSSISLSNGKKIFNISVRKTITHKHSPRPLTNF